MRSQIASDERWWRSSVVRMKSSFEQFSRSTMAWKRGTLRSTQFARRDALRARGLLHLLAVLVGAGEEIDVVAVEPHEARDGVGRDRLIGVADMRRAVRHRRARHQDAADGGQGGHDAARTGRPQLAALPGDGRARSNCSNDDFIRTTEPRHYARRQEIWQRMDGGNGDIYLVELCRLVFGARRGLLRRGRDRARARTASGSRPQGTPVEWVEEESYFFRLSAYQDRLLELYEAHPDFMRRRSGATRSSSFVQGRAAGPVDLAHHLRLGHSGARATGKHVMYVWVDALTNYITGVGFPDDRQRAVQALLAGRPARHRQGHRALPRGLLAGLPDVGRHRAAEARLRPRLPVQPRGEDVEVGRQRRSTRSRWSTPTASIQCAISSCARCRSGRTATTATRRSSTASMPTSPTISAIWRSARCR